MSREDATVEQVRKSLQGSINISTKIANSYITILKLYLIYLEPKCICMNDLSKQSKTGENETVVGNEILCVQGGFLQQRGKCNADEYCRGTTHLHEAECGTESLCKKGTTRIR